MDDYGLDLHCRMILEEYRQNLESYGILEKVARQRVRDIIDENKLFVTGVESRIKTEKSLAGKLSLKGGKYSSIYDITDILGVRVITFFTEDVDKIAALIQGLFEIDWTNSIDKRKMLDIDRFGYLSLHYICRMPKEMFFDPEHPEVNMIRFEIQMKTVLQHAWASITHDFGYKSDVEIPSEYVRNLNRLAGVLELADEQFSQIRSEVTEYRRQVQNLVASGDFNDVALNGDSYSSYLSLSPFRKLAEKIASVNQAEIVDDNMMSYLKVFKSFGFKTLGDIEKMRSDCSDGAYRLSIHQLGSTDMDIIAASLAVRNLCIVYILKEGKGETGVLDFLDILSEGERNQKRAHRIFEQAQQINLV
jgi:putative GTP pyrophosphokinase